jgi:hypothetical protein
MADQKKLPQIEVDEETRRQLKILAAMRGVPMREVVRKLVLDERKREAKKT